MRFFLSFKSKYMRRVATSQVKANWKINSLTYFHLLKQKNNIYSKKFRLKNIFIKSDELDWKIMFFFSFLFVYLQWNMEQFEQLLTCCVCLDRYRNPKLLPCQHSFCMEPCMEGLVDYVRRQVNIYIYEYTLSLYMLMLKHFLCFKSLYAYRI